MQSPEYQCATRPNVYSVKPMTKDSCLEVFVPTGKVVWRLAVVWSIYVKV